MQQPRFVDTAQINYAKNQAYNKYTITNSSGILDLSIPISQGRNQRKPFSDIEISYGEDWQTIHWRSLEAAYNNSPYFEFYQDKIKDLYTRKFKTLEEWNCLSFKICCQILQLKEPAEPIPLLTVEELIKAPAFDYLYKKSRQSVIHSPYFQVFSGKTGFLHNVSILDLIMNLGPESRMYLSRLKETL